MPTNPYREKLRQEFTAIIDALSLSDLQKGFLKSRWLDQVIWMEGKADSGRDRYYLLRLLVIVGGVIVPALVGLKVENQSLAESIRWTTFSISLVVAISAALEGFFRFGERWRNYRRTSELLKNEGWHFFQLSGPYQDFHDHSESYQDFASRVESIILSDVENYITTIVNEKTAGDSGKSDPKDTVKGQQTR
ncbi:MAG: DUF4231 domain-containing protein [Desulfuromonadales bacterium]|nr:DUF4231 domain-containing protein [Desulfuromonadales bacterium]